MSTHCSAKNDTCSISGNVIGSKAKCPRNVVQMKEAMAVFFGSDSVANSATVRDKNYFGHSFDGSVFSREYSVLKPAKLLCNSLDYMHHFL